MFVICPAVFLLVGNFTCLFAVPIGNSNEGREYLMAAQDVGQWSCGLYSMTQKRDVTSNGLQYHMKSRKVIAYVGYDFKCWFTTYAIAGQSGAQIGGTGYADAETELGVGMHFNILDLEVLDPTLFEDKVRVNGGWQYSVTETEWAGRQTNLRELSASLMLSIVNDIEGNKLFLPNSIALFAGPIYSDIHSSSLDEKNKFGFAAGIEVFLSEKISLKWAIERFDAAGYSAGINVRF